MIFGVLVVGFLLMGATALARACWKDDMSHYTEADHAQMYGR